MQRKNTGKIASTSGAMEKLLATPAEEVELLLPQYAKQIIIDFIHDAGTRGLQYKWDTQHPDNPCWVVDGVDLMQQNVCCVPTDGLTRIYIYAHGDIGFDSITAGNGDSRKDLNVSSKELAEALVKFIGKQPVIINLLTCSAACGYIDHSTDRSKNSFAASLQWQLTHLAQRQILVVARRTDVSVTRRYTIDVPTSEWKGKRTRSLTFQQSHEHVLKRLNFLPIHKQYGAKVVFAINEEDGRQYRLDAYKLLWTKRVFEVLNAELDEKNGIRLCEKRQLLEQWKKDFLTKTKSEMQEIMQEELDNPDSVLKKNGAPCMSLFGKPSTYKKVAALVAERKKIIESKYSQDLITTGLRLPRNKG